MGLIKNEKQLPKVYYGLHFCEGVAEYCEPQVNNNQPYRILLNESTIKNMDATFSGRPVYVRHVDEVNLDTIKNDADGYVVESFFNPKDGKHWVKFIIVSDEGHRAIEQGWKLSNAYIIKNTTGGGHWHGVEYLKEVTNAEYEHLAIVPNPRYEESKVLTPEQFKEYNQQKEIELKKLYNSKNEEKKSMFNIFKKTKVDNTADLESMSVLLPKSKVEKTISQIINESDEKEMEEKNDDAMANAEHHVMVGDEKMKINDLVSKHMELKKMHDELKAKHYDDAAKKHDDEMKKKSESEKEGEEKEIHVDIDSHKGKEENDESDEEAKKKALELAEHEEKEIEEEKSKKQNSFDKLKNAHLMSDASNKVDLSEDKVARGKSRYGSSK